MWVFDEVFLEELVGERDTWCMSSWRPVPGLLSWCSDFWSGHCGSSGVLVPDDFITSKSHLRVTDPRLGRVFAGPWHRHHGGRPGLWLQDWLPGDMPHFISLHFITIGLHCIWDTMMTGVYILYLYIDIEHILIFNQSYDCISIEWYILKYNTWA